ncbi:MAG: CDP-diacylglycerol--glycerol-3-phosphate 3-phosphatidyltransferase [Anaerovoracaceae bacterium]|nr:CDP-diacylglycerol--glycerol-3-phosphate 3-phosphatidyltransferase [Bacillota bacterium]MDY3953875.1 CDP-diacylglycerol--glycerol-3-phosphate 3-phosphatidyltransferase [Anaerovoracaceae bacterium]
MNLPNKLTILRVLLIPVFIVLLMNGYYYWSGIVFLLASFTDMLDGQIARKYNLITNFGKIMDPLADKLLVTSALICLVELGEIAGWMVIIILAREFIITGLRAVAAGEGIIIAAGKSGKLKTILQMTALTVILLRDWPFALFTDFPVGNIILWAAVIMTVYSGIEYIVKNKQVFLS